MHQGGLAAATDSGSAYGARHSFSSYSESFMNAAAPANHMNPVSNGLSPQVQHRPQPCAGAGSGDTSGTSWGAGTAERCWPLGLFLRLLLSC